MALTDAKDTPWGRWEVLLEETYCKVKRIIVQPGNRLSYQKHFKREEVWTIVQGIATITIGGTTSEYPEGSVIHIPLEAAHRIANTTKDPVIFIEIQRGTYFGEDDIVRLEDDYGRS
ncbi:MAG: mannose-6-phosphate isomerase [Candidatus Marinamargulisbacteria bacterium]|jgi:mannose-6-phosphate isomerase